MSWLNLFIIWSRARSVLLSPPWLIWVELSATDFYFLSKLNILVNIFQTHRIVNLVVSREWPVYFYYWSMSGLGRIWMRRSNWDLSRFRDILLVRGWMRVFWGIFGCMRSRFVLVFIVERKNSKNKFLFVWDCKIKNLNNFLINRVDYDFFSCRFT